MLSICQKRYTSYTCKKGKIMKFGRIFKTAVGYVWRLPLCAFAYVAGTMAGGALVSAIGMKLPPIPEQANEQMMGLCLLISSCALVIGVGPLARRIRARYWVRCLIPVSYTHLTLPTSDLV